MIMTDTPPFDLVVRNARVFDGDNTLPHPLSVGVRNGVIASVSDAPMHGRRTVDATGCWLTPGLIDSHVHLFDFGNARDPETMADYIRTALPDNLRAFLEHGVTTIKSVGDPVDELLATRARLEAGDLTGPRLLMAGVGITAPDGHPSLTVYGRNPWYRQRAAAEAGTIESARAIVDEMADRGMDAIKVLHQGGCRCTGEPPYLWHGMAEVNRLKPQVLVALIEAAHRRGLKATVHTYEQVRALEALEAGADGLEHGVVGEPISDDRLFGLLRRNDASYVPTLWIYPVPDGMRNLARVRDAGVRIVLGSDSFTPTVTLPGIESGRFGANSLVEAERMEAAGLAPIEVLRAATGAAAIHLSRDDTGSLRAGKRADMVLYRKDPTASTRHLRDPLLVIASGRVVHERATVVR